MGDFARHSPHHLRKFAHSGPTRPLHDGRWCLDTLLPHAETGSEASVWMPARVAVAPTRAVATSTESNSRGDRPHRGRDPGSPSSPTPRPVSGAHAAVRGGGGVVTTAPLTAILLLRPPSVRITTLPSWSGLPESSGPPKLLSNCTRHAALSRVDGRAGPTSAA